MIKLKCLLYFFFFLLSSIYGQSENNETIIKSKNTVYFELFGNAGYLYNISYDRVIFTKEKNNISVGLGSQYLPVSSLSSDKILSFSPQINYLYGIKHHFETGLGVSIEFISGDFVIPIRIGYRFQKPSGGLFYKIGLTPLYINSFMGSPALIPWGGLAIGWTF